MKLVIYQYVSFTSFLQTLEVTTVRRDEIEVPTEEELNKIVDIILEETDTIWLFDQKGVAISTESEEAQIIK